MPRSRAPFALLLAVILASSGVAPRQAAAQAVGQSAEAGWHAPTWIGDATFLGISTLLAGGIAGVRQTLGGGSFADGFARGALGGAIAYGGRRLAAREFSGAGLLGRQLSAVGISIAHNAGDGVPSLSRFLLPIGPVAMDVRRGNGLSVRPRIDVNASAVLLGSILDDRLELDAGASLSAGAPVFRAPGYRPNSRGEESLGIAAAGTIILAGDADAAPGHSVLAHERVHVLQHDYNQTLWGDPLEAWLGSRIPYGEAILRFVRPGLLVPVTQRSIVSALDLEWGSRPWEIEAEFLEYR